MDKIFMRADDTNVAARKIYVKSGDAYAYVDKACKTKIKADVLMDIFVKGAIIIDGTSQYKPVSADLTSAGVASVTYIKSVKGSGSTATATPTVLQSEEYTA